MTKRKPKAKAKKSGPHFVLLSNDDPNHYLLGPFKNHDEAARGVEEWLRDDGGNWMAHDFWPRILFFEFGRPGFEPKEAGFQEYERVATTIAFGAPVNP